jgi:hypothetical protein
VPGDDHPVGAPELGPGHDHVAVAPHLQVRVRAQGRLHPVGDQRLVPAHRLDVDQVAQQRNHVAVQIQPLPHAGHVTGPLVIKRHPAAMTRR